MTREDSRGTLRRPMVDRRFVMLVGTVFNEDGVEQNIKLYLKIWK